MRVVIDELSKSSEPQKSNETISSSPEHVRKISKIFQRSKSMEQLPKVSRIQKSSPSTGASASAIISLPSPSTFCSKTGKKDENIPW